MFLSLCSNQKLTGMEFTTLAAAKKLTGLSYLGGTTKSVKHRKAGSYGELTYALYLAPANTSGYEVCPGRTKECTMFCLNESGMNTMVRNDRGDMINDSRITKTRLFFEHREFFMRWLVFEIRSAKAKADRMTYQFSVRLNNTSDISPLDFELDGKNILEIFPDVQFYEYTKVPARVALMKQFNNYDVTFSYTGYNLTKCQEMLLNKIRVAVVFKIVPNEFLGYPVVNGDDYDMRYKDDRAVIIGLKYKRVRTKLLTNIKFVVQ
jgi:hypothetical protein